LDLPFGLRRRGAVYFVARPRRSAPQDRLGLASRIRSRPIPGSELPGGPPLGARNATGQLIVLQALTSAGQDYPDVPVADRAPVVLEVDRPRLGAFLLRRGSRGVRHGDVLVHLDAVVEDGHARVAGLLPIREAGRGELDVIGLPLE